MANGFDIMGLLGETAPPSAPIQNIPTPTRQQFAPGPLTGQGKRRLALAAIGDFLANFAALRAGQQPTGRGISEFHRQRQLKAEKDFQDAMREFELSEQRRREGEVERREIGREERAEQRQISAEQRREQEILRREGRARSATDDEFTRSLETGLAEIGGEFEEGLTQAELLKRISTRRRQLLIEERGEAAAQLEITRLTESERAGEGMLTAFMLGDESARIQPIEARLAAREDPAKIIFEFRRQLRPLLLTREVEDRLVTELTNFIQQTQATIPAPTRPPATLPGGIPVPETAARGLGQALGSAPNILGALGNILPFAGGGGGGR